MLSEKPWKPDLVVRLLAGLFSSMLLGVLVVSGYGAAFGEAGKAHRDLVIFVAGVLTFHGVGLALVHVFVRQHGIGWAEAFGFRDQRMARTVFLGVVCAMVMLPIALSLSELSAAVMRQLQMPVEAQQAVKVMQASQSMAELVLHGLAAILIAPLVEELVFRGILYPSLKQVGYPKLALWGTSIIFALTHGNLMILLPLTVLAIILTFLYETTNNLLAPIITHGLFNAANYAYLLYQRYEQGTL